MTRQHTEDRQLYNRTFPTSRAHRGSLSKRRELVLSSFASSELSFPLSRRATLRMPRPTTRSTSRSSRSSQPPTSNNDEPPSRSEPSPLPSSSQPPSTAPEWFTQALGSLQNHLAETRSAASEAVAATQMLSTEVRQLKRSSATTVESGKNVTFFEQLFCFYQLVLVV